IRVLVLATRMSGYMLACLSGLAQALGAEIVVVRRPPDADQAPFFFGDVATIRFLDRAALDRRQLCDLVRTHAPELILCFGWLDGDYLAAVRSRPKGCHAVMTMDTQWRGTARQIAGLVFARLKLVPTFDAIWVAGERQARFARLLGFRHVCISKGLYAADREKFAPIMMQHGGHPAKRLVFVGRYAREKGIDILWDAFLRYHETRQSDLELWCVGTGPLGKTAPAHPKIKHLGFRQPEDFAKLLGDGGIFILPSLYEPWGVVVQEFAIAGFPLILSSAVGAGDHYLTPENGILLDKVDTGSLLSALETVESWTDETISAFSAKSSELGAWPSVENWVETAIQFLK
ncbi:MAG: glycosyltransferase family 4 protein, partial [Planctomycetota bacterium]